MADEGWDVSDAISTATPVAAPHGAGNDGWDVSDAVTPIGLPTTSAYEAAGGRATWGDIGQALIAGGHGVAADAAGALAAVQEPGGPQAATQKFALSQEQAAHEAEQGMTPAGQAPGFFKHPLVSAAEATPGLVALAAPAALAGPFAPVVVGGLMGGQQLGEAQNRAAGQGYDLTPTQKLTQFGIGAATGLIPELGLPGKIVTTPLVDRALGIAESAATFGGGAAASEVASQQSEIGAGKRTGYDPTAIVSAGETGAEQGAAFRGVHSGVHRDTTQTPGETTVARTPEAQVATETKPRATATAAPADTPARVADASPPPPPPKVDPAQEAALNPPPVTPRVSEPQPPVVQPKPVEPTRLIQPETQPIVEGVGGPPAGDTTQPLRTPQTAEETRPAPTVAPANEDVGAIVREPDAALAAQHAALLDPANPREAMVYPKDVQPIELTKKSRYGQQQLQDGRTIQYDRSGPSKLSAAKVKFADENNRLNEILQLGPVSKDEAISRALAGEPGTVVTERTPDGTPVKAAVGTTATAPEQVASLEAAKTPGNVVSVETPEQSIGDRQARVAQEQGVQPKVVPTQELVNPLGKATGAGRVLEAQDAENIRARDAAAAQDALQAQTVAERLRAREAAKQEAAAQEAGVRTTRQHTGKTAQAKVAADNIAADKIAATHAQTGPYDPTGKDIMARARKMVAAAKVAGIDVPKAFPEGHSYHPSMLKLREAMDLIRPQKDAEGHTISQTERLGRFVDREHMIDTNRADEAFAARRDEGKLGLGSPEGAVEHGKQDQLERTEETGEHVIEGETAHEEGATELPTELAAESRGEEHEEAPAEKPTDAFTAAREERERTIAARRAESEALRKEAPAPASKAAMGFKQEVRKNRAIKRQEDFEDNDAMYDGEKKIMTTDIDGNLTSMTPQETTTIRDTLDEHFDPKQYSLELRTPMEHLRDALNRVVGDRKAHYIGRYQMMNIAGKAHGFYDPAHDHVVLNADTVGGKKFTDTALHEAVHAATYNAIEANPELKSLLGRLHTELNDELLAPAWKEMSPDVRYALSDPHELLTGLMTNPKVQDLLKGVRVSDALAKDLGIPRWRKATMWNGFLHLIQRALGLGPRDVSAIEAAMALTEKTMWSRDPGMAMEAGARSIGLKFQRMEPTERDPKVRDQEAYFKSPSEKIAQVKNIDRDMVKQYTKDKAGNLATAAIKQTAKFLSGTQLSDLHGKIFTDAKGNILEAINRARDKVSHTFNEMRRGDRDLVNRGYILDQKYASRMGDYAELLNLSSRFNIHADREAPKVPKNPVDAPRKNWQANSAQGDRARALYNSLPDELQKRYRDEKQYYRDKQQALAQTVLDKTLPVLDLPKDMEERVRANDLTDDDWEQLDKLHASDAIRNAQRLINKKDVYFPGGRGDGRFVVTGRYEMPKGGSDTDYSGGKLADNKREFDTEQEAHDYVANTHMPASVRETTYHTENGVTQRVKPDEAATSGTISKKYEVSLERQHTEMHDTHAGAVKARAEMEKAGVGELSGVLDKRNERAWSSIGSGEQQALERRIMNRDSLTTAEKQHLIESTRQLALGSQNGMSPHLLQSRKVAGAKFDTAEGLDAYSRAINQHISRNAHSTELNQAMQRLDEHENATRGDTDATTRSIIGNTMRDRVYDPNTGVNSKVSPLLHKLMTMSFVNFLVRPSHIFLSQVHPYVYSVPMMAGRHGYWKALGAQRQAMADLGGQLANLGRGAQRGADVFRSLREKDTDKAVALAHGGDPIREMINRLKDKGERDFLNKMYETQHLHSAYDQSMFTGGGIDRTNVMMQQFTNAMEANNRLSTALAAYRLEKGMHGDSAGALAYAQRVIEETHGLYSAGNTAPIFKNPLLRATLQFHQQPMNLAFMLYRNAYKAFKGDTEARWTLAYQLGTAAMLGGMGGMPMDLPKLAGIATQPVTGMAPSDWNDAMVRQLTDTLGPTAAHAIMEGLPGLMGPLGPSLGHRMGFDAGLINDEPKSASGGDILSWVAKNVAGAPGGMLVDWLDGAAALEKGDYQTAGEKFLPGSLKDFAKAYREGTTGEVKGGKTIRPGSFGDALLQVLGFSGVERERQMEGHYKLQAAIKAQDAAAKQTKGDQLKAKHAAKASVLGVPVSKKHAALESEYGSAYQ